uniref:Capsid protein n=1 Tax=Coleura bat astrovirus TaxID=3141863 RepID=A0AAU7E2G3_9VIRU
MMADSKKEVEKKIKTEVKKEVQKENKKKQYQKKTNKSKKHWKKEKAEIRKDVKKEIRKENQGPTPKFKVKVTATLGYIDGSTEHGPEVKVAVFLHPALCKGPDEEKAFGPLQAAAAQYAMWRIKTVRVRLTPLVGSSAVSGTIVRASLNVTSAPGSTSWGGLGARKHRDFQAGRAGTFILSARDTAGPRSGGWWITDTNVEGNQASGPALELHTLGQTMSTYKDDPFRGQLFIVEVTGQWEFANYTMHPGMGTLERKETATQAAITVGENNEIQMEIPEQEEAAIFMSKHEIGTNTREGENKVGEIIYQIVDTGAGLASTTLPPPFGWLVKGGWWFVKKLLGRGSNGNAVFKVYSSYAEAQNNKPAIAASGSRTANLVPTELQITQMNTNNVGGGAVNIANAGHTPGPTFPITQEGPADGEYHTIMLIKPVYRHADDKNMVLMEKAGIRLTREQQRDYLPAVHFQVTNDRRINRLLMMEFDGDNRLLKWPNPNQSGTEIEIRINSECLDSSNELVGKMISYKANQIGTADANNKVYCVTLLWKSLHSESTHWATVQQDQAYLIQRVTGGFQVLPKRNTDYVNNFVDTADRFYITIVLAKRSNISTLEDLKTATKVTAQFNADPTYETSLGLLMTPVRNQQFWAHFILKAATRRLTKVEKLLQALGIEDTDSESEETSDTESEEDDGFDTVDDSNEFTNVTHTEEQQRYENLLKLGLTHQQAEKVLKSVGE